MTKQDAHNTPPPPLEYTYGTAHNTVHDNNAYGVPSEHHDEPDDGAIRAEPDHDAIEPLTDELVFPRDLEGDWAEDMNEEMGYNLQGEYRPATYSPSPPPPSPTPWYPPLPPTTRHRRPRTNYTPNHAWYNPPCTPYMPRRPLSCPYTHPRRTQRPPCEIRTGHVTEMRRVCFRATTHAVHPRPPLYIPPALRSDRETPHES
jgi:hypothetical protein